MAGQICAGSTQPIKNGVLKNSKAFCEGMAYRAAGTAIAQPKTDNPHASGSDAAVSWEDGWDVAAAAAGSVISKANAACCAMSGVAVSA